MNHEEINLGMVIYVSSGLKGDVPNEQVGGAGIHSYSYIVGNTTKPINGRVNYAEGAYYDLTDQKDEDDEDDTSLEDVVETKNKVKLRKPKGEVVKVHNTSSFSQTYTKEDGIITSQFVKLSTMNYILSIHSYRYLKRLVIIEQGGEIANLLNKACPVLENNNWKNKDGNDIQYKDLIVELYDNYKQLSKETKLTIIGIPEDKDEYGINIALTNRNKAIYAGRHGIKMNDFYNAHINFPDEKSDTTKAKIDKHPFIQLKQVMFKKYVEEVNSTNYRYHFMSLPTVNAGAKREDSEGNVKQSKKDYFDYIGKSDTETIYQIADFNNPIRPIDAVSKQLRDYDKTEYNKVFLGILSEIYKTDNYFDLINYGGCVFDTTGSYNKRVIMKTAGGKIIGNEVSPPRRVKDALFVLDDLSSILSRYYKGLSQDDVYCFTDVTGYFYSVVKGKTDKQKDKYVINPDFNQNVKRINMVVDYLDKDKVSQLVYGFQIGYDVPPRGLFLHSASSSSKVTLITWPEVGLGVRYAIVIKSEDATCIWCNCYSNIILTKGLCKS